MRANSGAAYRFHREVRFARPASAIWPFVSDSARLWELSGFAPYRFEERIDARGRVRRFVIGKVGPFPARWEEDFGEWQENRWLSRTRHFIHGPFGRFVAAAEVHPEGRMVFFVPQFGHARTEIGPVGDEHEGILNEGC